MKEIIQKSGLFLLICTFTYACTSGNESKFKVDVSEIKINLEFKRLDKDLYSVDTVNLDLFNDNMKEKYGLFWMDYMVGVLGQMNPNDPMFELNFIDYLRRPYVIQTLQAVDSTFKNLDKYKRELTEAFKHQKYYFKDELIPDIVFSCNFFNYACVVTDSVLNIGLDFYLGSDHEIIRSLPGNQFADYLKEKMTQEYIVVDAIAIWIESHYMGKRDFTTLLDAMIYFGKIMYVMEAFLPEVPDHIKIKYTVDEMKWAYGNESRVWATLVDRNLLHSAKPMDIKNFINEAPFTAGLKDSEPPERIGVFLGWQFVRDFMEENEDMTIETLLKINDSQRILNAYKQGEE